ncbi:MAG: carbohydrate-binding protein [Verrucomicrobia bacterium]|nr:carbohydrate-binding protein [Verrucomicrobiota bacterium]
MNLTKSLDRLGNFSLLRMGVLLAGLLAGGCLLRAQQFGPIVTIPIAKVTEPYLSIDEAGTRKSCGVRLYGEWPAYLNYTNRTSYRIYTPGLARLPTPQNSVAVGGRFRFYCFFNGVDTPDLNAECPTQIGGGLPDWYVEVQRQGPFAAFQRITEDPSQPGRWTFVSRSTDPEGDPVTEHWEFGDGSTASGNSVVHQYTQPGTYSLYLTATDSDTLTNRARITVLVPAPKLESSLRMPDSPNSTKVVLDQDFKVRLRVGATASGVGGLSEVRFTTNAILEFPNWITVVEQPSTFELGTLQPGESRFFDFTLRATNIGKFSLISAPLVAKDAAGRTVNGPRATLNGSVPGLTVEVVFPEEPVRLTRKEQDEEENSLSEKPGYRPLGFPVTLRVSVPRYGRPVREVRLNNAEANDGGIDIDRVTRTENPEVPWVQAVPQPVPFPLTVTNKASPAMVPGVLEPGGKPVEFRLMVETDTPGDFSFTGIISALREDGLGEVTEVGSDVLTIGGDILLAVQVELVHPLVLPRITEGEEVEVFGKLKNMTWDDTIRMHPVRVISQGQGFVLGPAPYEGDLPPLGIPGIFDPVLKPREERSFRARVKTERIPGLDSRLLGRTNVLVDFAVGGVLIPPKGEERDLKPEDILVEWGKGRHRPSSSANLLRARVDPDPQDTPLLTAEQFFSLSAGKAMENIALGGRDFAMVTIPQTLGSILPATWAVLDTTGAAAVETLVAVNNAGRYLWAWADWQRDIYEGLDPETHRQQYQLIANELYSYYSDKFESAQQVQEIVNRGIEGYFSKVIDYQNRAYEASGHGFSEELAAVVGEPFRAGTSLVLEEIVVGAAVQSFVVKVSRSRALIEEAVAAKLARARKAEQELAEATAEVARRGELGDPRLVEATPGLKAIPGGTKVTTAQAIAGWAVDQISDRNLRRMTDVKNGGMAIIVALRSRADETIEWMKTPLGVVPKPVTFKPKNVDADDVAFLGYRDGVGYGGANGVGAGDRGATALAEPLSREEVLARLDRANADAATRNRVLERHDKRWKEWHGADWPGSNPSQSKVQELKNRTPVVEVVNGRGIRKGSLDVPKRGTTPDSSINSDVMGPVVMDQRRFEMRQVIDPPGSPDFPEGREYWECWLEDDTRVVDPKTGVVLREGAMRRIAGDIDLVAVTHASGHALQPFTEFTETVARNLQHGINAQHPWSSSLRDPKMRAEFLDPHRWHEDPAKRGEPLLLYVNGEARVGWFHPTREISADNPLDGFMWLDGGTGDVDDVVDFQRDLRGTIDSPADVLPPSFAPMSSKVRAAMINSDNAKGTKLLARCAVRTGRTGGAVYRLGQAETLEKRIEDGSWQPTDPALECNDGELVIVPETALSEDVPAGAFALPILEDLLGFNWREMFQIGDQVVINPGSATEEVRTVAGHGSIIVDRPLTYSHPMGTQILLHRTREQSSPSTRVPPPFRSEPLVWLRADAGLVLTNGTSVISWTDQSRNQFVFTAPSDATRPEWVTNSGPGVPAVRFAAASTPHLRGNLGGTLTNATIFSLVRWVDTSAGDRYVYSFGTPSFSGWMMTLLRRNSTQGCHWDGAALRTAADAIAGTGFRVFSQVYGEDRADRHRLSVDLQTVLDTRTTTGRAYSAVATNVVLGSYVNGKSGLGGDLVEWLVYDRVLSAEERFEVEEYLRQRAGLRPFVEPGGVDLSSSQILDFDVTTAPEAGWSLESANRQLIQAGAGDPSLVLSDATSVGQVIRTKISASAGSGSIGLVFGYQHSGAFHLLDWRQVVSGQETWGVAPVGMRLRSFHLPIGQSPTGADFWTGAEAQRVTIWRTNAVPWVAGREYDLIVRMGADETVVEVSYGATVLERWSVPELKGVTGQFGPFSHFLPNARFGPTVLPGAAPVIVDLQRDQDEITRVRWMNGLPPFVIESTTDLSTDAWHPVAPATPNNSLVIPTPNSTQLFRVRSAGLAPDRADEEVNGRSQTFGNEGRLWLVTRTALLRIEAENFDSGGPEVAYHDTTGSNRGGAYRQEAVDIGPINDLGGGYAIGYTESGEWLHYTIRVETPGVYRLRVRTARGQSGVGSVRFLFDGVDKTGSMEVPATGNWSTYTTLESEPFQLGAGTQILRMDLSSGGTDLNWFEISPE